MVGERRVILPIEVSIQNGLVAKIYVHRQNAFAALPPAVPFS